MALQAIHDYLACLVSPGAERVVDVGCGRGLTLLEIAHVRPAAALTGLDRNADALGQAAASFAAEGFPVELVSSDAGGRLPFPDGSFDTAVCHNVLECLPDPAATIAEIARIVSPGGEAILSHTDFGTLVFTSTLPDLSRRALDLYCDHTPTWADFADGLIGRKLPGLVRSSPLELVQATAHTILSLRFAPGEKAYERATKEIAPLLTDAEADAWLGDLAELDRRGTFFASETAYVVRARHPD